MSIIKASEVDKVMYGNVPIESIYKGSEKIYPIEHKQGTLEHYFCKSNNSGEGYYEEGFDGWYDAITGLIATIGNAKWKDGKLQFRDKDCIVRFPNKFPLQDYTISFAFRVETFEGTAHPRLGGERPMHGFYINHYSKGAAIYTPNQDREFNPLFAVEEDTVYVFTYRYRASTKEIELFVNGQHKRTDDGNDPETATAERWIGNRGTGLNRWLNGDFFEHMIYSSCLTDEEIAEEFEVTKILEKLDTEGRT